MPTQTQTKTQENGQPPPDPVPRGEPRWYESKRPIDWKRFGAVFAAWIKYWGFVIVAEVMVIGSIYLGAVSEGLRILVPELAKKLYKLPIPFALLLEQDEVGYRLDQAHAFAAVFLFVVLWLWPQALKYLLADEESLDEDFRFWDPHKYRVMILTVSVIACGADACFFFYSVTQMSWGGSGVSFASVIATVAYVVVLVVVSLIGLNLKQALINAKKGN